MNPLNHLIKFADVDKRRETLINKVNRKERQNLRIYWTLGRQLSKSPWKSRRGKILKNVTGKKIEKREKEKKEKGVICNNLPFCLFFPPLASFYIFVSWVKKEEEKRRKKKRKGKRKIKKKRKKRKKKRKNLTFISCLPFLIFLFCLFLLR